MDEDELDPRIQVELEKLNSATDTINRLEIELDEANTTFRMLLNECTRRLKVHSNKYGSAIISARPYYEALEVARNTQQECQRAAVSFQRANEVHEAAKETVALAEARFLSQQPEWRFDSAWQEMLNHATSKVREAEKTRSESAANHGAATSKYKDAQDKVQQLEQQLHRNVVKTRPYFEEKDRCNDQLAAQKEIVESLQRNVSKVKCEYANSLRKLEGISEDIHRRRANLLAACCGVREPGVGAELEYKGEVNRSNQVSEQYQHIVDQDKLPIYIHTNSEGNTHIFSNSETGTKAEIKNELGVYDVLKSSNSELSSPKTTSNITESSTPSDTIISKEEQSLGSTEALALHESVLHNTLSLDTLEKEITSCSNVTDIQESLELEISSKNQGNPSSTHVNPLEEELSDNC